MKKRINNLLFLFFYLHFFSAQVDVKFIRHLDSLNLSNEHLSYLNTFSFNSDSATYFKAKYNLKYFNDSLFMLNYSSSGKTCNKDTTLLKDAGLRFLNSDNSLLRKKWFSSFSRTSVKATQGKLVLIYDASENPINFSPDQLPLELRNSFISYRKIYSKKPLLAASFSAVIPGLGKLYAGKKKSALAAFLLNAGYAVQTVESINKLGVTHPFTIVNMCAFTVFYMSNIYGAYRSVIELRSERKKQFLVDATYFYN